MEKSEPKFRIGDKVRLKSGGPIMVINRFGQYAIDLSFNGDVHCQWFDDKNKPQKLTTNQDTLEKVD